MLISALISLAGSAELSVYGLTCENLTNPLGIESSPRFSWKLHSSDRGCLQTRYRILVASEPELLTPGKADMWDSGTCENGQSILVPYDGKSLLPSTTYYWTVQATDDSNNESRWSQPAKFTTGLPTETDWGESRWIAYEPDGERLPATDNPRSIADKEIGRYKMPLLRKVQMVKDKEIKQAMAYVCGLGHFDFFVNGEKVGDHFLDPGWTNYDKEAQYVAFDISEQIKPGANAIGLMLGNGFYNIPNERYLKLVTSYGAPKARVLVKIIYADGETSDIISDSSWEAKAGPITFSSIYGGEDFDATMHDIDWCKPGNDNKGWRQAVIADGPKHLHAYPGTHLTVRQHLPTMSKYVNSKGHWIYDLGQNFSGVPRIKVKGKKGQKVIIRPGELLNPDSTVNQSASGGPYFFTYTIGNDDTEEIWQPQFTYYGFRYLQVEGATSDADGDTLPRISEIIGVHTCSEAPEVGKFQCSSPMFNKIHELIDWAIRSNMQSVLTDCPHREKLGWQEEAHLMWHSLQYRYDLSPLYRKILADIAASQLESGAVPSIVPEYVRFAAGFEDSPEWGSSLVICPWYYYLWYGDTSLIEKHYDRMKLYVDYLGTRADNHIVAYGLGDWYDIGPDHPGYSQLTSNGLTSTAMYYYDTRILAQSANLLGKKSDASRYNQLADSIKAAYNDRFFNVEDGTYDRNSQTANAMSLYMGLVDNDHKARVLDNLIADIEGRDYALTAGDIGYRYVLQALSDAGRYDIIYRMNSKYDSPGYGWQIAHGATALTESWQAYGFVSNNHFMLGHLMEWLYAGIGGIRQMPGSTAYSHILIDPQAIEEIPSADVALESPYGEIRCRREATPHGTVELTVTIPENTRATIAVPCADPTKISDFGKPLDPTSEKITVDSGRTLITVGSGTYRFVAPR